MTRSGVALIGNGLVIALVAAFFDVIAPPNGFGWLQIAGLVAGIALIGAGIARALAGDPRFPEGLRGRRPDKG